MLTVLRSVLEGVGMAEDEGESESRVGTLVVDWALTVTGLIVGMDEGVMDRETTGILRADKDDSRLDPAGEGVSGSDCRVLCIGRGGSGIVGGARGGGRCRWDVMVTVGDMFGAVRLDAAIR